MNYLLFFQNLDDYTAAELFEALRIRLTSHDGSILHRNCHLRIHCPRNLGRLRRRHRVGSTDRQECYVHLKSPHLWDGVGISGMVEPNAVCFHHETDPVALFGVKILVDVVSGNRLDSNGPETDFGETKMPTLLTSTELVQHLKLSRSTLYRLISTGKLPVLRLACRGRLRFDIAEVTEALRAHRLADGQQPAQAA